MYADRARTALGCGRRLPGDERAPVVGLRQRREPRTVVDLPAPLGPSNANTSPSRPTIAVERLDRLVPLREALGDDRVHRRRV